MATANRATITGKTMGAVQLTSKKINNVTAVNFNLGSNVMRINSSDNASQPMTDIGLDSVTTVTITASASVFSVFVS